MSEELENIEETTEANEPLDINKLIDKPLNELTEEEAEFVIEWQAAKQFEEYRHSEANRLLKEQLEAVSNNYKEQSEQSKAILDTLSEAALNFYHSQE